MENGENNNENVAEVGTLENPSATGTNPDIPDMTPAAQANHAKHLQPGKSYPGMSMEEYVRKAGELVRSEVGGDIDGYLAGDGAVVRYNKVTHDWAKAYVTGVATMFIPRDEVDYFNRQKILDGGTT